MRIDELYGIADEAVREEELTGGEIPAIDLYVDQIINLVSDKIKCSSERYRDRQLTKTMINNYSKDGLITPIKGKKYNKEQIIQILTVYTLKNTLSIGEIKRLLDGAYSLEGFDGEALTETYDRYLSIKRDNRAYSKEILETLVDTHGLNIEDERDFMLIVGSLLSLSASLRNIAQAMIDVKYPVVQDEEEKDKDKEKDKEKPKKEKVKEKEKAKTKKKVDDKESDEGETEASVADK